MGLLKPIPQTDFYLYNLNKLFIHYQKHLKVKLNTHFLYYKSNLKFHIHHFICHFNLIDFNFNFSF